MKTTLLIFVLTALLHTSCKKKYLCNCTSTDTHGRTFSIRTETPNKVHKKDIQQECDKLNGSSYQLESSNIYGTPEIYTRSDCIK